MPKIRQQSGGDTGMAQEPTQYSMRPNPLGLSAFDASSSYVFISYSRTDTEFVTRFARDLQAQKVNIWIDQIGLTAGTPNWDRALRDAVRGAAAFLLVASPHSRDSNYVADEIALARMYERPIFPIWASGDEFIDSISMGMGRMQYIDARTDEVYAVAIRLTVEAIGGAKPELQLPEESLQKKPTLKPHQLVNPYKGLEPFRAPDRELFFGRRRLINDMVEALRNYPNFLGVLGASGSGKSSAVMAGLLPALQDGALPGSGSWRILTPFTPTGSPLERLADVFAKELPNRSYGAIREDLDHPSGQGAIRLARQVAELKPNVRVVLYVDQFEETFTLTRSLEERQQFIQLLTNAALDNDSGMTVILSLRADFYDRALEDPTLAALLQNHQIAVTRMGLAEVYEAVRAPAAAVGIGFEEGLVSDIVFAVRDEPGMLPLLQFTLARLYERRDAGMITRAAYVEIGEVMGALAQHAETTYAALPSDEHRRLTRDLFLKLITPGQNEQETARRRAKAGELNLVDPALRSIINEVKESFVKARLVTTDRVRDEETIEVSHEALIRRWDRLTDWLRDAREDVLFATSLNDDAADWDRRGRPADQPERLYQFSKLREAQDWATRNPPDEMVASFLQASVDYQAEQERLDEQRKAELEEAAATALREQQRAEQAGKMAHDAETRAASATSTAKRVRTAALFVSALAVAIVIIGVYFTIQQVRVMNNARRDADEARATSDAARLISENSQTLAEDSSTQAAIARLDADARVTEAAKEIEQADVQLATQSRNQALSEQEAQRAEQQIRGAQATLRYVATQAADLNQELLIQGYRLSFTMALAAQRAIDEGAPETAGLLSVLALRRAYTPFADNVLTHALDRLPLPIRTYIGHTASVQTLAFSPDGSMLVTGAEDGEIHFWDVDSSDEVDRLFQSEGDNYATDLSINPAGAAILIALTSGRADQRDLASGDLICTINDPYPVSAAQYSPDGRYFATGTDNGTVRLWDAETCRLLREYAGHTYWVSSLDFSRDGRWLVGGSGDNLAVLWDVATGVPLQDFFGHTRAVRSVSLSPDGKLLVTGSSDTTIRIWDTATGETTRVLTDHTAAVYTTVFSADGRTIISGSDDGTIRVTDVLSGDARSVITETNPVRSVSFAPDGRYIAAGLANGNVTLWDSDAIAPRLFDAYEYATHALAFSADGRTVMTGGDNVAYLWDAETGMVTKTLAVAPVPVNDTDFTPDGRIVVTGGDDDLVRVWNTETDAPARVLRGHTDDVAAVALSPDGSRVASASRDTTIRLWDTETGDLLHVLYGHIDAVNAIGFTPGGRYLVSADNLGDIRIWEVETGAQVRPTIYVNDSLTSLSISADGRSILVGSNSGLLYLAGLDEGAITGMWRYVDTAGNTPAIHSVAISPDSQRAVIGTSNGLAIIVPMSQIDGQVIEPGAGWERLLGGHSESVLAVAFSRDGHFIVTGGMDGTVRLWDTEYNDFIAYACSRFTRDFTAAEWQTFGIPNETRACDVNSPVVALGGAAGDLAFATDVPLAPGVLIPTPELEPTFNPDSFVTLTPRPVGISAVAGEQRGEVPQGGGETWLYAGRAGERLRISVQAYNPAGEGGTLDTRVLVYSPRGELLAESDDALRFDVTDSLIADLPLLMDGDYRIEVRSWINQSGGRYRMIISSTSLAGTGTPLSSAATLTATPSWTPVASPTATATFTITPTASMTPIPSPTPLPETMGTAVVGINNATLPMGGRQNWLYQGEAGEQLTISTSAAWDTTLTLFDGSGALLAFDDDALIGNNSQIIFSLPQSGTYQIEVAAYAGGFSMDYSLIIVSSITAPPAEIALTPTVSRDGTTSEQESIDMGSVDHVSNVGNLVPGTTQRWTYSGRAGETLMIQLTAEWDTVLALEISGGFELAYDDDGLGNLNSQIIYTLPEDGDYDIVVRGFGGVGGLYTLFVQSDLAEPMSTPSPTASATATATP